MGAKGPAALPRGRLPQDEPEWGSPGLLPWVSLSQGSCAITVPLAGEGGGLGSDLSFVAWVQLTVTCITKLGV